jgi:hypothetical protein
MDVEPFTMRAAPQRIGGAERIMHSGDLQDGSGRRGRATGRAAPTHCRGMARLGHAFLACEFGAGEPAEGDGQGILVSGLHRRYHTMLAEEGKNFFRLTGLC